MNEFSTDYPGYKPKLATKQTITFTKDSAGQNAVAFEVTSWKQAADSGLPLAAGQLVDSCQKFTASDEEMAIDFTAERVAPIAIGEKQTAVRLTATYQGASVHLTVYEAQVGHNLISMTVSSPEPTDQSAEYKPLLDGIITKLQA
ncbi:hypothetical protein GCM10009539_83420 [Cryptosporangium japonicum]|uniref:DUF1795 domain-containing protein n=1 Tax=Cryptosporangium japonicum TaxID=80872 RepID=A0ABN0VA49_9ACTN